MVFILSCSDLSQSSKQKSELERCVDANLILMQSDVRAVKLYQDILILPIKVDVAFMLDAFPNINECDNYAEFAQNLSNKDAAYKFFRSILEQGCIVDGSSTWKWVNVIINVDDEEISFSFSENGKIMDIQSMLFPKKSADWLIRESEVPSETELEEIKLRKLSTTLRLSDREAIAKNICWSQGIY
tara:strand:+ start:142 stop:699 length:558 start_codon:yes stop_codon:yes gene_type:complete